jgi:cytidine deaminase
MLIDHPSGPQPLARLLPDAFGPDDLARIEVGHQSR